MLSKYILLATTSAFLFSLNAMRDKENNSPSSENVVSFYSMCGNPIGYVYRGELQNKLLYDSPLAAGGRVIVTQVVRGSHEGEIEGKVYSSFGNEYILSPFLALWCFNLLSKRFGQQYANILEKA